MTAPGNGSDFYFRSHDLRLHALRQAGQGSRPVLVVPGITTPAGGIASFTAALAELPSVSEVYVLDMRGRGLSESAEPGRHRAEDYAEDALALVESARLDRPLLLGHSLGARVVVTARAMAPEASCGVLAIDPVLSGPQRPYPTQLDHFLSELAATKAGRGLEVARERFPSFSPEQLEQRVTWLATCDEVAIIESFSWFHLQTFEPVWEKVPPPAVLLAGDRSPAVKAEDASSLAELNPGATVLIAADAGHMVPWDNPGRCLEVVEGMLTGAVLDARTGSAPASG